MSWLKAAAAPNVLYSVVTDAIFQSPMSRLNAAALLNAPDSVDTDAIFHLPMSRLKAAALRAKTAAIAVIEEQLQRALDLSKINRGTTGTGGINRDDVVVEVFTTDKKSSAVARNTSALRAAGRIS